MQNLQFSESSGDEKPRFTSKHIRSLYKPAPNVDSDCPEINRIIAGGAKRSHSAPTAAAAPSFVRPFVQTQGSALMGDLSHENRCLRDENARLRRELATLQSLYENLEDRLEVAMSKKREYKAKVMAAAAATKQESTSDRDIKPKVRFEQFGEKAGSTRDIGDRSSGKDTEEGDLARVVDLLTELLRRQTVAGTANGADSGAGSSATQGPQVTIPSPSVAVESAGTVFSSTGPEILSALKDLQSTVAELKASASASTDAASSSASASPDAAASDKADRVSATRAPASRAGRDSTPRTGGSDISFPPASSSAGSLADLSPIIRGINEIKELIKSQQTAQSVPHKDTAHNDAPAPVIPSTISLEPSDELRNLFANLQPPSLSSNSSTIDGDLHDPPQAAQTVEEIKRYLKSVQQDDPDQYHEIMNLMEKKTDYSPGFKQFVRHQVN